MWGPSAAIQHAAQAVTSPAQRAASRLEALLAFLAASGARTARLVPADMLRLSTDAVSRAEAAMVAAYPTVAAAAAAAAAAARPTSAAERGGRDVRPQLDVSLPRRGVVAPLGPAVMLGGLTAAHAPGERVLLLRGAGPAPFGARGLVLASQGGTCEVLFEREGFCNTGRFAQLRTMRSAVLPTAALLLPLPLPLPLLLSPTLTLPLTLTLTLTLTSTRCCPPPRCSTSRARPLPAATPPPPPPPPAMAPASGRPAAAAVRRKASGTRARLRTCSCYSTPSTCR